MEFVFVLGTVPCCTAEFCQHVYTSAYGVLDAQTASSFLNFRTDEQYQYFSVIKNLDGDTATGLTVALIMIADVQTD